MERRDRGLNLTSSYLRQSPVEQWRARKEGPLSGRLLAVSHYACEDWRKHRNQGQQLSMILGPYELEKTFSQITEHKKYGNLEN